MPENPLDLPDLLAARRGHFRLESGHHGDRWLDLDHLFVRAATVRRYAAALAGRLAPHSVAAVAGPLTGGGFLAQFVAAELDAGFYYTQRLVTGDAGPEGVAYRVPAAFRAELRGQRVAVVDDVVNAGSAVGKTLRDVRDCGAVPVAVGALLVLGQSGARLAAGQDLPLEYVASQPGNRLWAPADCPLCAANVPLEDLVPA